MAKGHMRLLKEFFIRKTLVFISHDNIPLGKSKVHFEMGNPRYKEGFNSNVRDLYHFFLIIV